MNRVLEDDTIPSFIYGTAWKEEETARLTEMALEAGFRAIDTANQRKHYHEAGVGEGIEAAVEEGIVDRDELFLQTKFTYPAAQGDHLPYDADARVADQVRQSFESSLEHLGADGLDSYVLHGPSVRSGLGDPDREVWSTFEELLADDRVDALGVSNVRPGQLDELLDWADEAPDYVQNRCFARTGWDHEVREICEANDVVYQGFSLLTANERALRSDTVSDIADRHDRTVPQITFRFAVELGILPLTGTTDPEHMANDLEIFDFELDDDEVATLERIAVA